MSAPAHRIRYTYSEYLALEASSNVKHEYLDGQIYAMAGGTPEHAALAAAVIGLLFPCLRGSRCRAYDADLRVRTPTGLATYPDVTVVCGPAGRDRQDEQAVTNPTAIVEVLSRSTEDYDRADKFEHYKSLRSLQQYILVSHRERSLESGPVDRMARGRRPSRERMASSNSTQSARAWTSGKSTRLLPIRRPDRIEGRPEVCGSSRFCGAPYGSVRMVDQVGCRLEADTTYTRMGTRT
jgi:Uma2 family endonuclease